MDADDLKDFDRQLVAEPGKLVQSSRGTTDLMAAFGMPKQGGRRGG